MLGYQCSRLVRGDAHGHHRTDRHRRCAAQSSGTVHDEPIARFQYLDHRRHNLGRLVGVGYAVVANRRPHAGGSGVVEPFGVRRVLAELDRFDQTEDLGRAGLGDRRLGVGRNGMFAADPDSTGTLERDLVDAVIARQGQRI